MNFDSLEGSIQNLLSVLYPPFEATAPTLLSQLFQIIDSRYQGDTLRCLLDFLVPAKHILDTVQQAACAQYSDVLFLCEGWPLCLRDQVVIHLAPVKPLLLQPGDFYLQVAPFCDQSARIVVCTLLEEEGLGVKVVEETPIPETCYPCIFSREWLEELNQGRHGTPLSHCLLGTEQGLVRLPWEGVAVPEFVDVPQSSESSMASAPPTYPPLPPPLPRPSPHFPESSLSHSFHLSPSKESAPNQYPVTIQKSILTSSQHPPAFSVETRICPAKHGIAVSLCLVDSKVASSSKLSKVKDTEAERKPIGWVSPNMWDSRFTGTVSNTTSTVSSEFIPAKGETQTVFANVGEDKHNKGTNPKYGNKCGPTGKAGAEGDYIDILQASMLFGRAQSVTEQQKLEVQIERNPCGQAQIESLKQLQKQQNTEKPTQSQTQVSLQPKNVSPKTGPPPTLQHSQSHHPQSDSLDCVRTIRFSEKPCTPCMRRRQVRNASKALELRCRYRESYQAAIKNPVTFGQSNNRGNMLAVVEEDGGFSQYDNRQRPQGIEAGDPWCHFQGIWCNNGMKQQCPSFVSNAVCKESEEKNTAPCWTEGDLNLTPSVDCRGGTEWTVAPFSCTAQSAQPHLQNTNVINSKAATRVNTFSSSDYSKQSEGIPAECRGVLFSSSEIPDMSVSLKAHERLQNKSNVTGRSSNLHKGPTAPQNKRESVSERRCSSLSTAVVDTSEKCELVIVDGQNVRRRENADSSAEVPQLHVVKCKNSTAFRLVSPKINRRKIIVPDGTEPFSRGGLHIDNPSQSQLPPAAVTHRNSQPATVHHRPDHLPLGSPDPGAHPLYLGVALLTGGRDKTGRGIVELYGDHKGWTSDVTCWDLFQMLLYFHSITRREIRNIGMTLIFDARTRHPQPQLYKALMSLQEQTPQALNSLVLVVDKDNSLHPEKCPRVQTDVLSSMKALLKLVEVSQLTSHFDGTLSHSNCDWMELHQKLFPFVCDLHEASNLLLKAISKLEEPQQMDTVQIVKQCIMDQRTLMRDVLEDSKLVGLQREGGSILARLRKESDLKYPHCEDLSDAVDSVTSLYNQVEEHAHVLVQRSNMSLEHLEYLLQLREMEEHFTQMQQWFSVEGDHHLLEAESVKDSGDRMEQILNSFTAFLIEANDRRHHAMSLVSEAEQLQQSGLSYPETEAFRNLVCTFKSGLEDFLCRAEACGRELQIMVNVCDFCEEGTALASECIDYLNQSQSGFNIMQDYKHSIPANQTPTQPLQDLSQNPGPSSAPLCQPDISMACSSPLNITSVLPSANDISILKTFQDRFLHFSHERFQEVKAQASNLRGSRGMHVWNVAWLKCQEARQQLQERMQLLNEIHDHQPDSSSWCEHHYVDVVSTNVQTLSPGGQSLVVQSTPGPRHPHWEGIVSGAVDLEKRRPILGSTSNNLTNVSCCNINPKAENLGDGGISQESKAILSSPRRSARRAESDARRRQLSRARTERDTAALSQSHTIGCQWFPWGRGLRGRSVSQDSCITGVAAGSSTPPEQQVRPPSSCSHHGQPSCRILQEAQKFQISRHGSFCSEDSCMANRLAEGGSEALCCKHSSLPVERYPQESGSNALRLQRVLEELVFTEREYVRSLGYILNHYLPLLDKPDIPQDLRGKRGVIFGNLEKLYDFHSHYFLPEVEACQSEPAMVARCFLRHSESFSLYALYSKNKPQSDALILYRRHDIFKRKQQELGDMMDLSSYLLRPIQRISKYSLLLQDMLALVSSYRPKDMVQDVCGPGVCVSDPTSCERERAEIQAAAELVRFQMRHGNDLLTMDAIQDCDVNLKEQGQLIRQDEFTVFFRKKKCVRRIFLFQDLILFSKTKRTDVGNDVYVYKQSFKTSDIGMTHNSAVSPLCFEIWFRRRKSEDTYTLKASSMEVKKAWTTDLEMILWDQAAHSRELRIQERVFMGMGRKPYMDIQPSDAAICDRAVSCVLPERIPVACCSHRSLDFPRPHSIGSGSTASTTLSQSSSSSGRGSLPRAGFLGNPSQGAETIPGICSTPEAVTDNELNNQHLHQHHHHHGNCEKWKTYQHHLMDSTESSGESINILSSSESCCLSAIGGETLDDDSSFISQSSKPCPTLCRTPSLRRSGSLAFTRRKPGVAPKPQRPANAQSDAILLGKSTEV